MVSGSSVLEHGSRNLSLHSGLSQRAVSRLLAMLYAEPDPLLDVVTRGRMARADRFGGRPSKPESGNGLVSSLLVAEDALDDGGVLG